ncbi:MAG: hypothetical protein EXR72_13695 [Myxococcales bacterium]|nr:hypothetical protein [Myxococcales bacterium]
MRSLRTALVAGLLALAAAALIAHASVWKFFVTDDAFISFVYSRHLAEHGQLVFNLGEKPVEGYTNFLWTVFLAGWMKLGWRPESSSVVWGIVCAIGTMLVAAWWMRALRSELAARRLLPALREAREWSPWDAVPALLLAAVPGYACWATGGLETQMFTFFATLGSALYVSGGGGRISRASAIAFALAALTRPEGNLFFALAGAHRLLGMLSQRRYLPSRDEWIWGAIFLAIVVPHLLWRHHYYGYWVPNTFYIKSSGGAGTWGRGFYYLWRFTDTFLVYLLLAPPLVALWLRPARGTLRFLGWAAIVLPVFCLYVAKVGGDFMGLFRFVMPVVPLIAIACTLGVMTVAGRITRGGERLRFAPAALVIAGLGAYVWHDVRVDRASLVFIGPASSDNGIDTPGYLRWYTEDRAAIGRWFGLVAKPDDYAVVGGAGAQVYYSDMRSLDAFGLSDEHIAHNVLPVSNRPGHEKYAPVDYQIARRPTIITSAYYHIGGAPLVRDDAPWWREKGYHYVSVQIPGLSSPWYTFLKRTDRTLGPLGPDAP